MAYLPMGYFVAFMVSMMVELPMVSLEKLFVSKAANSASVEIKHNNNNIGHQKISFKPRPSFNHSMLNDSDNHNSHDNLFRCDNNPQNNHNQVSSVFSRITKLPSINRIKSSTTRPMPVAKIGTVSQVVSFDREEDL